MNVCRHIVLSESNEIRGFLPNVSVDEMLKYARDVRCVLQDLDNGRTFYTFDPFPPQDSVAGFQRPPRYADLTPQDELLGSNACHATFRPTLQVNSAYNSFGMLLRSFLPNFNLEVRRATQVQLSMRSFHVLELPRCSGSSRRCCWRRRRR